MKAKYLEALLRPQENKEVISKLFEVLLTNLEKQDRTLEEDLVLIAVLDILSTDLYDRTIGIEVAEEEEEEGE